VEAEKAAAEALELTPGQPIHLLNKPLNSTGPKAVILATVCLCCLLIRDAVRARLCACTRTRARRCTRRAEHSWASRMSSSP
jgi:hypothetical protein